MNIVKSLISIVGGEYAFAAGEDRADSYHDLFSGLQEVKSDFEAVVLPGDVDELQAVVKAVRDAGLAIWSMPNAAGNGTVISRDDRPAVLIDQQRMNRILEVNDVSGYALVEPGVSYRQLYSYLRDNNLNLWIDPDRNAEHSIAGSIGSRQVGYTPYGNHMLMQCGMEVVLADGEMLRTGMGALPGSDTWQLSKYNFGPYLDGLFTQSDLALVSKIGLWLMPPPPVFKPFMVTLPSAGAMEAMVEVLRDLRISNTIPNTVAVSNIEFEIALHHAPGDVADSGTLPPETIRIVSGLGAWNVFAALYGSPGNVDLIWGHVSDVLGGIDGAVIFTGEDRGDDPVWQKRSDLMNGVPVDSSADPGNSALKLTAAAPIEGEAALRMLEITERISQRFDLNYRCEYAVPSRTLMKQIYLPYTSRDDDSWKNAMAAARLLVAELTAAGYGIIDESLPLRRVVDNHYSGTGLDNLVGRIRSIVNPA